jgi:hypothetical protein
VRSAPLNMAEIARNAPAVNLARCPIGLLVTLVVVASSAVASCTTSAPATLYTPITGIQISAADIVTGRGCGTGSGQVYKYVAVLSYPMDACAFASGSFDCFADGIFSNLAFDSGSQSFDVSIYAYNEASFPQALECLAHSVPRDQKGQCVSTAEETVQACETSANWTSTCTATQVQGVTTIAACGPLEPTGAGSTDAGSNESGDAPLE